MRCADTHQHACKMVVPLHMYCFLKGINKVSMYSLTRTEEENLENTRNQDIVQQTQKP